MTRARFAIVATFVGASVAGTVAAPVLAQKAPEFKSVLAGKKIDPPFKGEAEVEYLPATKRTGDTVTTTMRVKNLASGPIVRLTIDEVWFDKGGNIVGGSKGTLAQVLAPGAVDTITIQTPWSARMNGNGFNFSHANGTVKLKKVRALDESAGKTAAAAKPAAKKK